MQIIFMPSSKEAELVIEPPISAKKALPDWYKKIPPFDSKNLQNIGLKMCMPFFDATTGGYIQRTWTDIHIKIEGNVVSYNFAQEPLIMSARETPSISLTEKYYPIEFVWQRQWSARLPKGYSLLITHPHNRLDLPFQTLSGLVDAAVKRDNWHTKLMPFNKDETFQRNHIMRRKFYGAYRSMFWHKKTYN